MVLLVARAEILTGTDVNVHGLDLAPASLSLAVDLNGRALLFRNSGAPKDSGDREIFGRIPLPEVPRESAPMGAGDQASKGV